MGAPPLSGQARQRRPALRVARPATGRRPISLGPRPPLADAVPVPPVERHRYPIGHAEEIVIGLRR